MPEPEFVPIASKWFLAQVVVELRVEKEPGVVGHINYHLIRANSAQGAYRKAVKVGRHNDNTHVNRNGHRVTARFLGLRELTPVWDEDPGDGAEVYYEEVDAPGPSPIRRLVRPKRQLSAFLPIQPRTSGPDYGSRDIEAEARALAAKLRPGSRRKRG